MKILDFFTFRKINSSETKTQMDDCATTDGSVSLNQKLVDTETYNKTRQILEAVLQDLRDNYHEWRWEGPRWLYDDDRLIKDTWTIGKHCGYSYNNWCSSYYLSGIPYSFMEPHKKWFTQEINKIKAKNKLDVDKRKLDELLTKSRCI